MLPEYIYTHLWMRFSFLLPSLPGRGFLKTFHILQDDEAGELAQPNHTLQYASWEKGMTRFNAHL